MDISTFVHYNSYLSPTTNDLKSLIYQTWETKNPDLFSEWFAENYQWTSADYTVDYTLNNVKVSSKV